MDSNNEAREIVRALAELRPYQYRARLNAFRCVFCDAVENQLHLESCPYLRAWEAFRSKRSDSTILMGLASKLPRYRLWNGLECCALCRGDGRFAETIDHAQDCLWLRAKKWVEAHG